MEEQLVHRHFEDTFRPRRKRQLRFAAKCKFKLLQNTGPILQQNEVANCSKTETHFAAK